MTAEPADFPLLLWDAPPALGSLLAQEGVSFLTVRDEASGDLERGRFLLFDGRAVRPARVARVLRAHHVAIDIDRLRDGEEADPFARLLANGVGLATWDERGIPLRERVAECDRSGIRRRVLGRLRALLEGQGALWARLAPFPFPYRSAFNFRVDLDEPIPDDYARFAAARADLEDCTTYFVSTAAYGGDRTVLDDLRRFDAQSHGHYHVLYRDRRANRANIERAHRILAGAGLDPVGFAAPEGRWNAGADGVLEALGYRYSSDFQAGYDDLPFYPWRGDRFSRVLQIPVHPISEGLFFDAGVSDGRVIGDYFARCVRAKVDAREPAFVYGHPERRLARCPEVLAALAAEIAAERALWRVTLTDFAAWWQWRLQRTWSLRARGPRAWEVVVPDWNARYPLGLEVSRGDAVALVRLEGPRVELPIDRLPFERRKPVPSVRPPRLSTATSLKDRIRAALDWETVTPRAELPVHSVAAVLKKGLRTLRDPARRVVPHPSTTPS